MNQTGSFDEKSRAKKGYFKGTVSPVLSWLKVVWLNVVESGEGPLVVFRFYLSSVNLHFKISCSQQSCKKVVDTHITSGGRMQTFL